MKITVRALSLCLAWLVVTGTCAVAPSLRFTHLAPDNALSPGIVYAITEGQHSFMWFGTATGLDRYYGTIVETLCNDPDDPDSLLSAPVRALYEDDGALWVATNRGLNRFGRQTEKFRGYTHDTNDPRSLSGADVMRVQPGGAGGPWVLTARTGLNRLDPKTGQAMRYRRAAADPDNLVSNLGRALLRDRAGSLWVGTRGRLDRFDSARGARVHGATGGLQGNQFANGATWKLRSGELAFGGDSGFSIVDPRHVADNSFVPPVVLAGFQLYGRPTRIAVDALLPQAIDMLEKQLSRPVQWGDEVPHFVHTDTTKLRQVLINLMDNAIKFTVQGGVLLQVTDLGKEGREVQRRLCFTVADTEPWIGAEEQARLFQPFAQTLWGLSTQEGTGPGLAISRQYVQLLEDDIQAESEPGQSSRFSFELALEVVANLGNAAVAEKTVFGPAPGQPVYRALIADDIDNNRQPLCSELAETINGEKALARWHDWQPDLIPLEMRMPKLGGYAVARHIHAEETGRHTPIIVVIARALEEQRSQVLAAGCDEFPRKPFREVELFKMPEHQLRLKYLYAEDGADTQATHPVAFDGQRLAALPGALLTHLSQALPRLDMQEAGAMAQTVSALYPALGSWLRNEPCDMRFGPLLHLCERAAKKSEDRE